MKNANTKRSPMFYVGDKYRLINEIKQYFPKNINTFIEPFVGGGTVFLNIQAKKYILNDIDQHVYGLHNFLKEKSGEEYFLANVLKHVKSVRIMKNFPLLVSCHE